MEHPVALKRKTGIKKQTSSQADKRSCIVHFSDTDDTVIIPLTEKSFIKLKDTAAKRLMLDDK